jgi:hypothetical protein
VASPLLFFRGFFRRIRPTNPVLLAFVIGNYKYTNFGN